MKMKNKKAQSNLMLRISIMLIGVVGAIFLGMGISLSKVLLTLIGELMLASIGGILIIVEIIKKIF